MDVVYICGHAARRCPPKRAQVGLIGTIVETSLVGMSARLMSVQRAYAVGVGGCW